MTTPGTLLYTVYSGHLVGCDEFENFYYRSTKDEGQHVGRRGTERRWVIYNGKAEPSKIPAYWHGWLHHLTDNVIATSKKQYSWEREHQFNLTGTKYADKPSDHASEGLDNKYESWNPDE